MSDNALNRKLLDKIKRIAKEKSREDHSLSYNQWLNFLCSPYGFHTFDSLQRRIHELEQLELEEALAAENREWRRRLQDPMVWGHASQSPGTGFLELWPLPTRPGHSIWPHCFVGSLFSCGDGPRRQINGKQICCDETEVYFKGEELRIADDQSILQTLISVVGVHPCGRLVEFTAEDLDDVAGVPLAEWGMPVQYEAIARSLWRFVHCELEVSKFNFKGPILVYADARQAPRRFAIRFNPQFANFFYPVLSLFSLSDLGIATK